MARELKKGGKSINLLPVSQKSPPSYLFLLFPPSKKESEVIK